MLEVSEKISALAEEKFWEIKTQCQEFAAVMLSIFKDHSSLLAVKDDIKGGNQAAQKPSSSQNINSFNVDKT